MKKSKRCSLVEKPERLIAWPIRLIHNEAVAEMQTRLMVPVRGQRSRQRRDETRRDLAEELRTLWKPIASRSACWHSIKRDSFTFDSPPQVYRFFFVNRGTAGCPGRSPNVDLRELRAM
jgi:hypothetical protein